MKKCNHHSCDRIAIAKNLCDLHYRRMKKWGCTSEHGSRIIHIGDEKSRFEQKFTISENGCWIWKASKTFNLKGTPYGKFSTEDGRTMGAHRFSFELYVGKIEPGNYICHKCDTPLCVNPDHLFQSTHKGNMRDMVGKGRSYKGKGYNSNRSKINKETYELIKKSEISNAKTAKLYKVSESAVGRIKRGETFNEN